MIKYLGKSRSNEYQTCSSLVRTGTRLVFLTFRGTCSSVEMLKGYILRERLGIPGLNHHMENVNVRATNAQPATPQCGSRLGDTEKVDMSHVIDKQMLKKGGHRRNAHAAVNSKPQVSCLKKLLTTARCAEYHLASYGLDRS